MFDERVFFAGSNGAPDAYEQLEIEQGGVTVLEQSINVVYKFDVSYKFQRFTRQVNSHRPTRAGA